MGPRNLSFRCCENTHADQSLVCQRVENTSIKQLKEFPNQARVHSRKQIKQLIRSIERFGFINPVLVDAENRVVAGWGRVLAAKEKGQPEVPTLRIEHLNDDELRAYVIADNRHAEQSGWDRELLAVNLQGLVEIGFDVEAIGFATAEVDIRLEEALQAHETTGPEDNVPETEDKAITTLNDLWGCGPHQLLCADARDRAAFERVLGTERAALVITDPPYNVKIDGHVSGLGINKHADFAMASGEMSEEQFCCFLATCLGNMATHSRNGSLHYIFMDWRHVHEMMTAGKCAYSNLLNICVWCKTNAGMGSHYRSQHELVFVWRNGDGAHVNNIELGRHGRSRSNVWTYAGVNSFRRGRTEDLAMHPTVKPVALIADAIKDSSIRNAIVLDPFLGAGTTLIAAQKTGRKARGIELNPRYVDVAVRRWQTYTGKPAIHIATGLTFEQMETRRSRVRLEKKQ